jgi:ABC-2 type transport system ATP-binding protein
MPGGAVLACRELVKRYGPRLAVDRVSFEIGQGECYGLLGPNGAGKTTTISMVCGIVERDGGEVVLCGEPVSSTGLLARRHLGLVPQEVALYPELSAAENLRFFARLHGLGGRHLAARVDAALAAVGLSERAGERVDRYSGGMRRRANLAVALVHEPELLVLDEPTVGVDPQSRNAIFELVRGLVQSGTAVLYTTHYMEEAERLCDRIGIIDEGRLVAEGTRRELVARCSRGERVRVRAASDARALAAALAPLDGVTVEPADGAADGGAVDLVGPCARSLLGRVVSLAEKAGLALERVEVVEPDLEAVFLELTGKALRD